jgi:hypothetical protein
MDYYKLSNVHDMLALMLDLWFKDLNLVGDYVGQATTIEIAFAYDSISFFKLLGYVSKFTIWMVEH